VREYQSQATASGSSGDGYTVTPFGEQWLAESDKDDFVPTEPERFGELIAKYKDRFGPTFQERSQEAVRCYGAHAYLACCAMCGAAAEAILLAVAIEKVGDVEKVLREYNTAGGRQRTENRVLGQATEPIRKECRGYLVLLKYWRDRAAHGSISGIDDNEAFTSLALLLRLAAYVNDHWLQLTSGSSVSV
jgi:hypothetical protein